MATLWTGCDPQRTRNSVPWALISSHLTRMADDCRSQPPRCMSLNR